MNHAVPAGPAPVSSDHERGRACRARGDLVGAIEAFERALAREGPSASLLYDIAETARDLGNLEGAEFLFRNILAMHPMAPEPANALANVLAVQNRHEEAIALLTPLLAAWPNEARLRCTLASLKQASGDLDQARVLYEEALRLSPRLGQAHANLALVHAQSGALASALSAAEHAVALMPENADARFNLATIRLALGQFAAAWPDYEARFAAGARARSGATKRPFDLPTWHGEALDNRPLLLWGEQGIGEEILFAALIPDACTRSSRVMVECDPRLAPLFARSFPQIESIPRRDPPDQRTALGVGAVQSAMGSLCSIFRRGPAEFRGHAGYLKPDPARIEAFRARYRERFDQPLIGISWRTRDMRNGRRRATSLADWLPILSTPGVTFVDLQYDDTEAERTALQREHGILVYRDETVDPLRDLDDQAAQIAALDGVITVQNATMYLAVAVGAKPWVLLPHYRDWRWPATSQESPWLPTALPFIQDAPGDWTGAVARVAAALAREWARS